MKSLDDVLVTARRLLALSPLSAAEAPTPPRPILPLLLAGDWAWPHAPWPGTPGLQTRTPDRLTREGMEDFKALWTNPEASGTMPHTDEDMQPVQGV